MREDLVEIVARAIATTVWKFDVPAYEMVKFREDALAALRAIEGAGMKVVGREPTEAMIRAAWKVERKARKANEIGSPCVGIYQAAFDAAPAFGGEE